MCTIQESGKCGTGSIEQFYRCHEENIIGMLMIDMNGDSWVEGCDVPCHV